MTWRPHACKMRRVDAQPDHRPCSPEICEAGIPESLIKKIKLKGGEVLPPQEEEEGSVSCFWQKKYASDEIDSHCANATASKRSECFIERGLRDQTAQRFEKKKKRRPAKGVPECNSFKRGVIESVPITSLSWHYRDPVHQHGHRMLPEISPFRSTEVSDCWMSAAKAQRCRPSFHHAKGSAGEPCLPPRLDRSALFDPNRQHRPPFAQPHLH